MLAEECFPESVESEPDHAIADRKAIDPRVYRVRRLKAKYAGQVERITLNDAFDAVHDPGYIADAADNFGRGEQLHQRRELRAPGAIGVEDDLMRMNGMIVGGED